MNIKLIDLEREHSKIKEKILEEINKVFDKSSFIMGENVVEFEKEFSNYLGVKHCISVGNGTDALVIALRALGIKKGDEVITTPYTFFATAESISAIGAIPVFVDVELDTYNIDTNKIEEKITKKTKAIMPVHIFGQSCNLRKINEIAKKHNLFVIEDACQAVGAKYDDKMVGNLSNIACFSFFPTKNLGCAGDGGAIVTNDDNLATICKAFRTHGSGKDGNKAYNILNNKNEELADEKSSDSNTYNPLKYYNYLIGYNSRLDEVQAAILRIKLKKLNDYAQNREDLANYYNNAFKKTNLKLPKVASNSTHVYHLYMLQHEKRDELVDYLNKNGIATGIYYKVPLHLQKAMTYLGYKPGDFPNSEKLSKTSFAIPMFPGMKKEEKEYIVKTMLEGLNE